MKPRTQRMTVECPFCQTAYTFRDEAKYNEYVQVHGHHSQNRSIALHTACKKALKEKV